MVEIPGYTILQKVSEGEYSLVFTAIHDQTQRKVIIKMLKDKYPSHELIAHFKQEYYLLKLAGTVPLIGFEIQHNIYAIIMEDDGSKSVKDMIKEHRFTLEQFFEIALMIIKSLEMIHSHHIVHKDINPTNILWNPTTKQANIIDFGLSSILASEETEFSEFQEHGGMLAYISPEQTGRLNRPIDYRTDFYSLGVTFYEMLTGIPPFRYDDILELIHAHLTIIPESISSLNHDVPLMVTAVINKLMAKMPEDRYSSLAGLKADLTACRTQWMNKHEIDTFVLGKSDTQDHLIMSQKLYGREEQVIQMLNIFEKVSKGSNENLLVSGYSGIGKTSLIKEIYKPITQRRGYFISGKFDQINRNIPYSAFIDAFNDLVTRFLTISESELQIVKEKLNGVIGDYAELVKKVIPNIDLFVSSKSTLPQLSPNEIQKTLTSLLKNIVQVFAQPQHPLVIFLDDLQWADINSLTLINTLVSDKEIKNLFFIGSYRDNEVKIDHPLVIMQEEWENNRIQCNKMHLKPLNEQDVHNMLSDSLAPTKNTTPLSDLLYIKTRGNPFFINQFLKMLYQNNLLRYSYDHHCWKWDLEQIEEQHITENVIDLLISRIKRLPSEAQEILELAACIGFVFNIQTLSIISEKSIKIVYESLWELLNDSFIVPNNKNILTNSLMSATEMPEMADKIEFRFIHDRVQQASYQAISEKTRKDIHLKIGRLLIKNKVIHENDKAVLEILPHFNYSSDLITNKEEKLLIATFNLWGGQLVASAAAFAMAKEFYNKGIYLIKDFALDEKYKLYFELYKGLAAAQLASGEITEAEINYRNLLSIANNKLSAIEVANLACYMLTASHKLPEVIKIGIDTLKLVNIHIPLKPGRFDILKQIIKIKFLLGRRKINDIHLEPMKSEEYKEVTKLLEGMCTATMGNPYRYILFNLINIELSLKYGYTKDVLFSYLLFAVTLFHKLKWYKQSQNWLEFYNKHKDDEISEFTQVKTHVLKTIALDSWVLPYAKLKEETKKIYITAEKQYVAYAAVSLAFLYSIEWLMGKSLVEIDKIAKRLAFYVTKKQIKYFIGLQIVFEFEANALKENTFQLSELKSIEQNITATANINAFQLTIFYTVATRVCYLFGQNEAAVEFGKKMAHYRKLVSSINMNIDGAIYYALALLAIYPETTNKKWVKNEINAMVPFIESWANLYPPNFGHYKTIILAIKASLDNSALNAIELYSQAIDELEKRGNIILAAATYESASQLYLEHNLHDFGNQYIINAYKAYLAFGAIQKATLLKNKYPDLITLEVAKPAEVRKTVSETALGSIDVLSLMRATQIISEEMQLDNLLQKLLIILLQNAGADTGTLITKDDTEGWFVRAQGTISAQEVSLSKVKPLEKCDDLPLSLIHYVQRTNEAIVVQDDAAFTTYNNDPFFKDHHPQSIVIIPIIYKNNLNGVLYLENNRIKHAFTQEHLHILKVLSSQAAISIENAQLYYQATHDPLTGLANRNLLYHLFKISVQQASHHGFKIAILYYDLDGFKKINDSLGHNIGDKVLIYVADQIKLSLRSGDLAVRLGGDEFVSMLIDTNADNIVSITNRFLEKIKQPLRIEGHEIYIGSSIGVSFYPENSRDISELLKQADKALYQVKSSGKGACQFYSSSIENKLHEDGLMEKELREALEKNQFEVFYQPIFNANSHQIVRMEALLRWNHPRKGLLSAAEFITAAELTGTILPLTPYVLDQVAQQIAVWQSQLLTVPNVAVNISGIQLTKQPLSQMIKTILNKYKLTTHHISLEFTESMFIDSDEKIIEDIEQLNKLGIVLALDDFGTLYSSLSYLRRFAVQHIKIDKSFIKDVINNERDQKLVNSIVTIARNLKIKVVAEGIETEKQMLFLENSGVDELQGYYLSVPLSGREFGQLLISKNMISSEK